MDVSCEGFGEIIVGSGRKSKMSFVLRRRVRVVVVL